MTTWKYIYFFLIYFVLLVSVTCNIEKKIKCGLKKISREIKTKGVLNKNLLAVNNIRKLPSLPTCTASKLKSKIAVAKLKSKLTHSFPKIKPPKLLGIPTLPLIPPLPPLLPVLPLLPPIPLIPPLPLLPLPILPPPLLPLPIFPPPLLPTAPKILKSLRLKKLENKLSLQQALGSEMKPVVVKLDSQKSNMLGKLMKLKTDGALTTDEYLRFKRLLKL